MLRDCIAMKHTKKFTCVLIFSSFSFYAHSNHDPIQELVLSSHMMEQLNTEFGPFESFMQDIDHLKKEMAEEGLSEKMIEQNLVVMGKFHETLQNAKKIILSSLSCVIEEHLKKGLSQKDIKHLVTLFKDPALIKFQKIVEECMPEIIKRLAQEKDTHLKQPFEDMVKNLVRRQPSE